MGTAYKEASFFALVWKKYALQTHRKDGQKYPYVQAYNCSCIVWHNIAIALG